MNKVSPKNLHRDALPAARLLARVANRADIKQMLEEKGLAEVLRWERRYPFPACKVE